jgi:hypothetical protein
MPSLILWLIAGLILWLIAGRTVGTCSPARA